MMLLEGSLWEAKYESCGELPDPSKASSDDEAAFLEILKREIVKNPHKFRTYLT